METSRIIINIHFSFLLLLLLLPPPQVNLGDTSDNLGGAPGLLLDAMSSSSCAHHQDE